MSGLIRIRILKSERTSFLPGYLLSLLTYLLTYLSPVLMYGLEAWPLIKSQLLSLDFAVD